MVDEMKVVADGMGMDSMEEDGMGMEEETLIMIAL